MLQLRGGVSLLGRLYQTTEESLKQVKERANRKNQALNRDGGAGAKGAQPPQKGMAKVDPAKAKN